MSIHWGDLNYLAIVLGGFLYMIFGAIYYTIFVGKESQSPGATKYVISAIVAFISSFSVAMLVQATGAQGAWEGVAVGGLIGILISLVYLKNTLFGLVKRRTFMIAIGDHLIIFSLLGAVHGLMA